MSGINNKKRKTPPNRRRLTSLYVSKAVPGKSRIRTWDTDTPGLVLQVEPSGAKSWYACYRRNGRPRWFRLGSVGGLSLSGAREAVRMLNAKLTLDSSFDPQAEKIASRTAGTVADIVDRYVSGHLEKLKSGEQAEYLLRRFVVPKIGKLVAAEVQPSDIRTLLKTIPSQSIRHQLLANISGLWNWSIRNDLLPSSMNPATGIEQRKPTARERVLSDAELPMFFHAFDGASLIAGRALRIILYTGQRPGEVRQMRWQDLEFGRHQFTDDKSNTYASDGAWWTLQGRPSEDGTWPGTKNGQSHRVWLSKPALRIIEELDEERSTARGSPFVFPGRAGHPFMSLDASMRQICTALDIVKPDKVTPHDLRRTHGTTTTSLGFSRDQMNRIQNHKEGGIG
ncbi:MAG: integrase family protein, partial [Alphaproteobacteria bacterium]|nr:integrase family protein [Alphaproteobacteria bacterium]